MAEPHIPPLAIMPAPKIQIIIISQHKGNNRKKHAFNFFQTSYLIVIWGVMPDSLTCSGIQTVVYQLSANCCAKSCTSLHSSASWDGRGELDMRPHTRCWETALWATIWQCNSKPILICKELQLEGQTYCHRQNNGPWRRPHPTPKNLWICFLTY